MNPIIRGKPLIPAPANSWNLRDLKDTRENIADAVRGAAFVPEKFKAAIVEAIEQHDPKARLLRVDAHCQIVEGKKGMLQNFNITISEL